MRYMLLTRLAAGLHKLSRANRPKSVGLRNHRAAVAHRIQIQVRNAYKDVLQEKSAHGSMREVEIEALILRLKAKGVLDMVCDPDDKGSSAAERDEFAKFFDEMVRSFDEDGDGLMTSNELDACASLLSDKVMKAKTSDRPLPTFESLGIVVPQTVFFADGVPVLW